MCTTKKTVSLPKGNIPTYEFKRTKKNNMFQLLTNILNPTRWFVILTSKKGAPTKRYTNTSVLEITQRSSRREKWPKAPVGEVCPLGCHAFFWCPRNPCCGPLWLRLRMDKKTVVGTLPQTNIAPENRPCQKEISFPNIHFQVLD